MNELQLTVIDRQGKEHLSTIQKGENLRAALLRLGFSPYTNLTGTLNCGGNGICATCGVYLYENAPDPQHWHDRLAAKFHYPRLSCQIIAEKDLVVEIPKKIIWGNRKRPF
jgi:ferredoxin